MAKSGVITSRRRLPRASPGCPAQLFTAGGAARFVPHRAALRPTLPVWAPAAHPDAVPFCPLGSPSCSAARPPRAVPLLPPFCEVRPRRLFWSRLTAVQDVPCAAA